MEYQCLKHLSNAVDEVVSCAIDDVSQGQAMTMGG